MNKQYHFRLDDEVVITGVAHEMDKQGASMKLVMQDLLRRGLAGLQAEREHAAFAVYQGRVANPDRVVYSEQAPGSLPVPEEEQR